MMKQEIVGGRKVGGEGNGEEGRESMRRQGREGNLEGMTSESHKFRNNYKSRVSVKYMTVLSLSGKSQICMIRIFFNPFSNVRTCYISYRIHCSELGASR